MSLWMPTIGVGAAACCAYGMLAPNSNLFGRVIGRGPRSEKTLYLTFDDGPSPSATGRILETLEREQVPATFFAVGKHVDLFPDLARGAALGGQEVGNHTQHHPKLHLKGARFIEEELRAAHDSIASATGSAPRSFRAPHGYQNPFLHAAARRFCYDVFGWTVGVWDSDRPGAEEIRRRVRDRRRPGAIILLHYGDGYDPLGDRSQTADALPGIIRDARDSGYEFHPLRDLVAHRELPASR